MPDSLTLQTSYNYDRAVLFSSSLLNRQESGYYITLTVFQFSNNGHKCPYNRVFLVIKQSWQ